MAELITGSSSVELQLFGIMKLVRVLRLNRIITYLNVTEELKVGLKLMKLCFFLSMYIHCMACLWWIMVKESELWIPTIHYPLFPDDLYIF